MIIPIKKNKKYIANFNLKRRIEEGVEINVKKGKRVDRDDVIAVGHLPQVLVKLDIVSMLGIELVKLKGFIRCIHGERVKKGDILAVKKGGVLSKEFRVTAPVEGIIDLSDIKAGILKILGTSNKIEIKSGVKGKVLNTLKNKYVSISTQVLRYKPFDVRGKSSQGRLAFIESEDGKTIKEEEIVDAIVFLRKKTTVEFLRKLEVFGASGVIIPSINYDLLEEFLSLSRRTFACAIIEGYVDIDLPEEESKMLRNFNGSYCLVDSQYNELIFAGIEENAKYYNSDQFVGIVKKGDIVQLTDYQNWGKFGKVLEVFPDYVKVDVIKSGVCNVDYLNLLMIDEGE